MLFEGLDVAIVQFDAEGRGVRVNAAGAALLGRAAGAIAATGWLDVIHPDDHPIARVGHFDMLEAGRAAMEVRAVAADGRVFEAEVLLLLVRGAGGEIAGHHQVVRDVTRAREQGAQIAALEASIARRDRGLEELVSIAAHELDEPARKVTSFAELLHEGSSARLDDTGRDYLERIRKAARRLHALLRDLRALSRVATATLPFSPVDLGDVARSVVIDLEAPVKEKGARVTIGDLPTIEADAFQMQELLANLVKNALRFHKPGEPPSVRIEASVEPGDGGGVARLTVTDEGIGFDQAYATRIFRPFERLHGRGVHEGSGVGLAVCSKIVERHGGSIEARGAPGAGATFIVTLPIRRAARAR